MKTELKSKQHHRVTHFAWFSSQLFRSIQRYYLKVSSYVPRTGTKFVGAQKTEISISADGDFGEDGDSVHKPVSWQVEYDTRKIRMKC